MTRRFHLTTDHQRCTPAEFETMRPALNAARRETQTRISLAPDTPRRVADLDGTYRERVSSVSVTNRPRE